ncbi:MAG: hypothetical protein KDD44_14825, partial [Bdellovibrionales bacterium]|nr:hypothetical protein [Bdellovibrionales bacterium]
ADSGLPDDILLMDGLSAFALNDDLDSASDEEADITDAVIEDALQSLADEEPQAEALPEAVQTGTFLVTDLQAVLGAVAEEVVEEEAAIELGAEMAEPLDEALQTGAFFAADLEALLEEQSEEVDDDLDALLEFDQEASEDLENELPPEIEHELDELFSLDSDDEEASVADEAKEVVELTAETAMEEPIEVACAEDEDVALVSEDDAEMVAIPLEEAVSTGEFLLSDLEKIISKPPVEHRQDEDFEESDTLDDNEAGLDMLVSVASGRAFEQEVESVQAEVVIELSDESSHTDTAQRLHERFCDSIQLDRADKRARIKSCAVDVALAFVLGTVLAMFSYFPVEVRDALFSFRAGTGQDLMPYVFDVLAMVFGVWLLVS